MSKVSLGFRIRETVWGVNLFLSLSLLGAQEPLQTFEGCTLIPTEWADGDSFLVALPDGREEVFRLYYVDCIETSVETDSDKRRFLEQRRYFGIEDYGHLLDHGLEATDRTREVLEKPFTVFTSFANARGRSGKPRHYGFIRTSGGVDLARLLVQSGLARAHGVGRETPTGTSRDDYEAYLEDLELAAAIRGVGIWEHSDPLLIVEMRERERAELRELERIDAALEVRPPSEPIDVNSGSLEDLMRAGLREDLADGVIQDRYYNTVDDIIRVKGIGPKTLEKVRTYLTASPPP